jgi:hypothetical protein
MLLEWLEMACTPAPPWLREMGYLRELAGIRQRYRAYRRDWEPHCERSRQVIRQAVGRCAARRKAVVLGSGFLHDVPLGELCAAFAEVVLVDLAHPPSVRLRTLHRRNVRLLAADVSGAAHAVWRAVEARTPLPRPAPELFLGDAEADLVVSLNLLSQLPCMPEQYVRAARTHPPREIDAFCGDVVSAHLAYLRALPGVVTLISDVEKTTLGPSGAEAARHGTLYGVDFPYAGERWVWPLVPRRGPFARHAEHLLVAGVVNVKDA